MRSVATALTLVAFLVLNSGCVFAGIGAGIGAAVPDYETVPAVRPIPVNSVTVATGAHWKCVDATTSRASNGTTVDCKPYICGAAGTCTGSNTAKVQGEAVTVQPRQGLADGSLLEERPALDAEGNPIRCVDDGTRNDCKLYTGACTGKYPNVICGGQGALVVVETAPRSDASAPDGHTAALGDAPDQPTGKRKVGNHWAAGFAVGMALDVVVGVVAGVLAVAAFNRSMQSSLGSLGGGGGF